MGLTQNGKNIINGEFINLYIQKEGQKRPNFAAADWGKNWGKGYHQFAYRNMRMPFVGREEEKKKLINFLAGDQKFKWLIVTGRAGSGKSTLVYNALYENEEIRKNWKIYGPTYKQLEDFNYFNICQSGIKNIVFVLDYVLIHVAEIGEWIESIYSECEQGDIYIRIILIERFFEKKNEPYWYIKLTKDSGLDEILEDEDEPYHIQLENCLMRNYRQYLCSMFERMQNDMNKYMVKNWFLHFAGQLPN